MIVRHDFLSVFILVHAVFIFSAPLRRVSMFGLSPFSSPCCSHCLDRIRLTNFRLEFGWISRSADEDMFSSVLCLGSVGRVKGVREVRVSIRTCHPVPPHVGCGALPVRSEKNVGLTERRGLSGGKWPTQ